jgi:hypothetical protein
MVEFMIAGGWSMWFVLLLGLGALVAAILFVARRNLGKLALVRALTIGTLFAIASGLCANLASVMTYASRMEPGDPQLARAIMAGLAESVAPGILGFTMLSISWLLVAVGTRRAQDRIE